MATSTSVATPGVRVPPIGEAGFSTSAAVLPGHVALRTHPECRTGMNSPEAAVVHDYLYWTQGCTRAQADRILLLAMEDNGVSAATRQIIYRGVRAGGDTPW